MSLTICDHLFSTLTFFSLLIFDVNKSKNIGPTPTKPKLCMNQLSIDELAESDLMLILKKNLPAERNQDPEGLLYSRNLGIFRVKIKKNMITVIMILQ